MDSPDPDRHPGPNRPRLTTALAAIVLALLGTVVAWVTVRPSWSPAIGNAPLVGAAWALFALAIWSLRRVPVRAALVLILLGATALPFTAALAPPRSSDDLYRYLWDGRVQAAGIDPYRYAPAATALVRLRDDYLWPAQAHWSVPAGATDTATGDPLTAGSSRINRPTVHTIYPPVAQAYFVAVHAVASGGRARPIQLAGALFALATTILLVLALPRLGLDPRRAALWAWCPTVALEAGNNAHVDVVAAFLSAAALVLLARAKGARGNGAQGNDAQGRGARGRGARGTVAGGAMLGLAIATKMTPALLGPALLRRRPVAMVAGAFGAVIMVYLPHLVAVGPEVLGFLPGYLNEEGYRDGSRFALFTLVLPELYATASALVVLAVLAALVCWRADPDRPWQAATVMVGGTLLVTSPGYSWYALLLVMLVAFSGRAEWLAVAAAGHLALYAHDLGVEAIRAQRIGYGLALVVVFVVSAVRLVLARSTRPRAGRAGTATEAVAPLA